MGKRYIKQYSPHINKTCEHKSQQSIEHNAKKQSESNSQEKNAIHQNRMDLNKEMVQVQLGNKGKSIEKKNMNKQKSVSGEDYKNSVTENHNNYQELKNKDQLWVVGNDKTTHYAVLKTDDFESKIDISRQATEYLCNNESLQEKIRQQYVKDGSVLYQNKQGQLFTDKECTDQKLSDIKGNKHFVLSLDQDNKPSHAYVLHKNGKEERLLWCNNPSYNNMIDLKSEITVNLENISQRAESKMQQKVIAMNGKFKETEQLLNNLISQESFQFLKDIELNKGIGTNDAIIKNINSKLKEKGHKLVFNQKWYVRRDSVYDKNNNLNIRVTIKKLEHGNFCFAVTDEHKQSNRISKPGQLDKNMNDSINKKIPADNNKVLKDHKPLDHEAHHLIPDAVAQNHPLIKAAMDNNAFNIDHASNGIWLPNNEMAKEKYTYSKENNLPIHDGSHRRWNEKVEFLLNVEKHKLEIKHKKKISQIDVKEISKAIESAEQLLRENITTKQQLVTEGGYLK